jgi:CRISPR-associated protein Csm2
MIQPLNRPTPPEKKTSEKPNDNQHSKATNPDKQHKQDKDKQEDIVAKMVNAINQCEAGLHEYGTRVLVEDTEKLGKALADNGLKTNQIRKFLDAVNQLRVQVRGSITLFDQAKSELDLLRPKLAYAAARQRRKNDPGPVEPLRKVLEAAIKQVYEKQDFERLVQLIESIVAYHKAAGGTDQ